MKIRHLAAIVLVGTIAVVAVAAAGSPNKPTPQSTPPTTAAQQVPASTEPATTTTQSDADNAAQVTLQMDWANEPKPVQTQLCHDWLHGDPQAAIDSLEEPGLGPYWYPPTAVTQWFDYTCR